MRTVRPTSGRQRRARQRPAGTRTTARSSGSPSPRSVRSSPSRCSCSPTRRSSATSDPAARRARRRRRAARHGRLAVRLPRLRHHRRRSPAGSAPATCAPPSRQGVDGLWLALGLGVAARGRRAARRRAARRGLRPRRRPRPYALTYLRISLPACPRCSSCSPRPACCAACRTPAPRWSSPRPARSPTSSSTCSWSTGSDLGVAGSALGTVLAQLGHGGRVRRRRRARCAPRTARRCAPTCPASGRPAAAGVPLVVRTADVARRAAADDVRRHARSAPSPSPRTRSPSRSGCFLSLALDAIAIAGQAIVGRYLGAGDAEGARAATRRMVEWGVAAGVLLGAGAWSRCARSTSRCSPPDADVRALLASVLVVAAVCQPVCGVVFALDGVLIGAGRRALPGLGRGRRRWPRFVPLALLVLAADAGLVALWWAFNGFLLARLVTLVVRWRGERWLVTGAALPRRTAGQPLDRRVVSRRWCRRRPRAAGRRGRCAGRTPRSCAARAPGCRWSSSAPSRCWRSKVSS